jgi:hypothetical protein
MFCLQQVPTKQFSAITFTISHLPLASSLDKQIAVPTQCAFEYGARRMGNLQCPLYNNVDGTHSWTKQHKAFMLQGLFWHALSAEVMSGINLNGLYTFLLPSTSRLASNIRNAYLPPKSQTDQCVNEPSRPFCFGGTPDCR